MSGSLLKRVPSDVWVGGVLLIGAAFSWREAASLPISPLDGVVNAALIPTTLAKALAILSVVLILRAVLIEVAAARGAASVGPTADATSRKKRATPRDHARAIAVIGIGVAYVLLLDRLGYALSVGLLIGALALFMGARPNVRTAAVAIGGAAAFYALFHVLLGVRTPAGFWPSLFG